MQIGSHCFLLFGLNERMHILTLFLGSIVLEFEVEFEILKQKEMSSMKLNTYGAVNLNPLTTSFVSFVVLRNDHHIPTAKKIGITALWVFNCPISPPESR